jgi:hypothetical protein
LMIDRLQPDHRNDSAKSPRFFLGRGDCSPIDRPN